MNSLATELPKEQARVRELIDIYKSVPFGSIAAGFMEQALKEADKAVMSGDVVAMLRAYEELKGFKE